MNATIITASQSTKIEQGDTEKINALKEESNYIAGANAGICYASSSYFDERVSGRERALNRCDTVLGTNHHSVANHAMIEVLFEGISKSLAMILNNLTFYATSEKSGRYTRMHGSTNLERSLYDKWMIKLMSLIKDAYPDMDEKLVTKLAMENARLFISANAPIVTMGYSAALNQWSYIIQWLREYADFLDVAVDFYNDFHASHPLSSVKVPLINENFNNGICVRFSYNLSREMKEVANMLENLGLKNNKMNDPKRRKIRTFFDNDIRPPKTIWNFKNSEITHRFDDVIISRYKGSFALVAQMQRHRTLQLKFAISEVKNNGTIETYCPDIVAQNGLRKEWEEDMAKLFRELIIPLGTMLDVKMIGTGEDYDMMFSERLCGRAQHEIMKLAFKIAHEVNIAWDVKTKCQMNGGCKEPCMFIKDGLDKKKI